jgi:AcrR family transcriptional regulator
MTEEKQASYHHGDLRAALLEVAAEMIAVEGAESLTLRALSRQIGVSRTAPYRHFADKSALLAAVAEQGFQRLQQHLDAVLQQKEMDPLNRFQQMGVAYIQFAVANPTHYRLMFSSETADFASHPDLETTAKAVFDTLVTSIQQCQAADKIRAGEPRSLAYAVWASVHGLSSLLIDERIKNVKNTEDLATFVTQTLLDGVIP